MNKDDLKQGNVRYEIIREIIKCDFEIKSRLGISNLDYYPDMILELGDTYIKKTKLIEKLIKYNET